MLNDKQAADPFPINIDNWNLKIYEISQFVLVTMTVLNLAALDFLRLFRKNYS